VFVHYVGVFLDNYRSVQDRVRYRDIYDREGQPTEVVLAWSADYEQADFCINAEVISAVQWVWFHCKGNIFKYERENDEFRLVEICKSLKMPLKNQKAFQEVPSVFGRD